MAQWVGVGKTGTWVRKNRITVGWTEVSPSTVWDLCPETSPINPSPSESRTGLVYCPVRRMRWVYVSAVRINGVKKGFLSKGLVCHDSKEVYVLSTCTTHPTSYSHNVNFRLLRHRRLITARPFTNSCPRSPF